MENVDFIGYLAMFLTIQSFSHDEQRLVRIFNSIASLTWIMYGVLIDSVPLLITNLFVILMHAIWFIRNKQDEQEDRNS
jgi:hypothetical protein